MKNKLKLNRFQLRFDTLVEIFQAFLIILLTVAETADYQEARKSSPGHAAWIIWMTSPVTTLISTMKMTLVCLVTVLLRAPAVASVAKAILRQFHN